MKDLIINLKNLLKAPEKVKVESIPSSDDNSMYLSVEIPYKNRKNEERKKTFYVENYLPMDKNAIVEFAKIYNIYGYDVIALDEKNLADKIRAQIEIFVGQKYAGSVLTFSSNNESSFINVIIEMSYNKSSKITYITFNEFNETNYSYNRRKKLMDIIRNQLTLIGYNVDLSLPYKNEGCYYNNQYETAAHFIRVIATQGVKSIDKDKFFLNKKIEAKEIVLIRLAAEMVKVTAAIDIADIVSNDFKAEVSRYDDLFEMYVTKLLFDNFKEGQISNVVEQYKKHFPTISLKDSADKNEELAEEIFEEGKEDNTAAFGTLFGEEAFSETQEKLGDSKNTEEWSFDSQLSSIRKESGMSISMMQNPESGFKDFSRRTVEEMLEKTEENNNIENTAEKFIKDITAIGEISKIYDYQYPGSNFMAHLLKIHSKKQDLKKKHGHENVDTTTDSINRSLLKALEEVQLSPMIGGIGEFAFINNAIDPVIDLVLGFTVKSARSHKIFEDKNVREFISCICSKTSVIPFPTQSKLKKMRGDRYRLLNVCMEEKKSVSKMEKRTYEKKKKVNVDSIKAKDDIQKSPIVINKEKFGYHSERKVKKSITPLGAKDFPRTKNFHIEKNTGLNLLGSKEEVMVTTQRKYSMTEKVVAKATNTKDDIQKNPPAINKVKGSDSKRKGSFFNLVDRVAPPKGRGFMSSSVMGLGSTLVMNRGRAYSTSSELNASDKDHSYYKGIENAFEASQGGEKEVNVSVLGPVLDSSIKLGSVLVDSSVKLDSSVKEEEKGASEGGGDINKEERYDDEGEVGSPVHQGDSDLLQSMKGGEGNNEVQTSVNREIHGNDDGGILEISMPPQGSQNNPILESNVGGNRLQEEGGNDIGGSHSGDMEESYVSEENKNNDGDNNADEGKADENELEKTVVFAPQKDIEKNPPQGSQNNPILESNVGGNSPQEEGENHIGGNIVEISIPPQGGQHNPILESNVGESRLQEDNILEILIPPQGSQHNPILESNVGENRLQEEGENHIGGNIVEGIENAFEASQGGEKEVNVSVLGPVLDSSIKLGSVLVDSSVKLDSSVKEEEKGVSEGGGDINKEERYDDEGEVGSPVHQGDSDLLQSMKGGEGNNEVQTSVNREIHGNDDGGILEISMPPQGSQNNPILESNVGGNRLQEEGGNDIGGSHGGDMEDDVGPNIDNEEDSNNEEDSKNKNDSLLNVNVLKNKYMKGVKNEFIQENRNNFNAFIEKLKEPKNIEITGLYSSKDKEIVESAMVRFNGADFIVPISNRMSGDLLSNAIAAFFAIKYVVLPMPKIANNGELENEKVFVDATKEQIGQLLEIGLTNLVTTHANEDNESFNVIYMFNQVDDEYTLYGVGGSISKEIKKDFNTALETICADFDSIMGRKVRAKIGGLITFDDLKSDKVDLYTEITFPLLKLMLDNALDKMPAKVLGDSIRNAKLSISEIAKLRFVGSVCYALFLKEGNPDDVIAIVENLISEVTTRFPRDTKFITTSKKKVITINGLTGNGQHYKNFLLNNLLASLDPENYEYTKGVTVNVSEFSKYVKSIVFVASVHDLGKVADSPSYFTLLNKIGVDDYKPLEKGAFSVLDGSELKPVIRKLANEGARRDADDPEERKVDDPEERKVDDNPRLFKQDSDDDYGISNMTFDDGIVDVTFGPKEPEIRRNDDDDRMPASILPSELIEGERIRRNKDKAPELIKKLKNLDNIEIVRYYKTKEDTIESAMVRFDGDDFIVPIPNKMTGLTLTNAVATLFDIEYDVLPMPRTEKDGTLANDQREFDKATTAHIKKFLNTEFKSFVTTYEDTDNSNIFNVIAIYDNAKREYTLYGTGSNFSSVEKKANRYAIVEKVAHLIKQHDGNFKIKTEGLLFNPVMAINKNTIDLHTKITLPLLKLMVSPDLKNISRENLMAPGGIHSTSIEESVKLKFVGGVYAGIDLAAIKINSAKEAVTSFVDFVKVNQDKKLFTDSSGKDASIDSVISDSNYNHNEFLLMNLSSFFDNPSAYKYSGETTVDISEYNRRVKSMLSVMPINNIGAYFNRLYIIDGVNHLKVVASKELYTFRLLSQSSSNLGDSKMSKDGAVSDKKADGIRDLEISARKEVDPSAGSSNPLISGVALNPGGSIGGSSASAGGGSAPVRSGSGAGDVGGSGSGADGSGSGGSSSGGGSDAGGAGGSGGGSGGGGRDNRIDSLIGMPKTKIKRSQLITDNLNKNPELIRGLKDISKFQVINYYKAKQDGSIESALISWNGNQFIVPISNQMSGGTLGNVAAAFFDLEYSAVTMPKTKLVPDPDQSGAVPGITKMMTILDPDQNNFNLNVKSVVDRLLDAGFKSFVTTHSSGVGTSGHTLNVVAIYDQDTEIYNLHLINQTRVNADSETQKREVMLLLMAMQNFLQNHAAFTGKKVEIGELIFGAFQDPYNRPSCTEVTLNLLDLMARRELDKMDGRKLKEIAQKRKLSTEETALYRFISYAYQSAIEVPVKDRSISQNISDYINQQKGLFLLDEDIKVISGGVTKTVKLESLLNDENTLENFILKNLSSDFKPDKYECNVANVAVKANVAIFTNNIKDMPPVIPVSEKTKGYTDRMIVSPAPMHQSFEIKYPLAVLAIELNERMREMESVKEFVRLGDFKKSEHIKNTIRDNESKAPYLSKKLKDLSAIKVKEYYQKGKKKEKVDYDLALVEFDNSEFIVPISIQMTAGKLSSAASALFDIEYEVISIPKTSKSGLLLKDQTDFIKRTNGQITSLLEAGFRSFVTTHTSGINGAGHTFNVVHVYDDSENKYTLYGVDSADGGPNVFDNNLTNLLKIMPEVFNKNDKLKDVLVLTGGVILGAFPNILQENCTDVTLHLLDLMVSRKLDGITKKELEEIAHKWKFSAAESVTYRFISGVYGAILFAHEKAVINYASQAIELSVNNISSQILDEEIAVGHDALDTKGNLVGAHKVKLRTLISNSNTIEKLFLEIFSHGGIYRYQDKVANLEYLRETILEIAAVNLNEDVAKYIEESFTRVLPPYSKPPRLFSLLTKEEIDAGAEDDIIPSGIKGDEKVDKGAKAIFNTLVEPHLELKIDSALPIEISLISPKRAPVIDKMMEEEMMIGDEHQSAPEIKVPAGKRDSLDGKKLFGDIVEKFNALYSGAKPNDITFIIDNVEKGETIRDNYTLSLKRDEFGIHVNLNIKKSKLLKSEGAEAKEEVIGRIEGAEAKEEVIGRIEGAEAKEEVIGRIEGVEAKEEVIERIEGVEAKEEVIERIEGVEAKEEVIGRIEGAEAKEEVIGRIEGAEAKEEVIGRIEGVDQSFYAKVLNKENFVLEALGVNSQEYLLIEFGDEGVDLSLLSSKDGLSYAAIDSYCKDPGTLTIDEIFTAHRNDIIYNSFGEILEDVAAFKEVNEFAEKKKVDIFSYLLKKTKEMYIHDGKREEMFLLKRDESITISNKLGVLTYNYEDSDTTENLTLTGISTDQQKLLFSNDFYQLFIFEGKEIREVTKQDTSTMWVLLNRENISKSIDEQVQIAILRSTTMSLNSEFFKSNRVKLQDGAPISKFDQLNQIVKTISMYGFNAEVELSVMKKGKREKVIEISKKNQKLTFVIEHEASTLIGYIPSKFRLLLKNNDKGDFTTIYEISEKRQFKIDREDSLSKLGIDNDDIIEFIVPGSAHKTQTLVKFTEAAEKVLPRVILDDGLVVGGAAGGIGVRRASITPLQAFIDDVKISSKTDESAFSSKFKSDDLQILNKYYNQIPKELDYLDEKILKHKKDYLSVISSYIHSLELYTSAEGISFSIEEKSIASYVKDMLYDDSIDLDKLKSALITDIKRTDGALVFAFKESFISDEEVRKVYSEFLELGQDMQKLKGFIGVVKSSYESDLELFKNKGEEKTIDDIKELISQLETKVKIGSEKEEKSKIAEYLQRKGSIIKDATALSQSKNAPIDRSAPSGEEEYRPGMGIVAKITDLIRFLKDNAVIEEKVDIKEHETLIKTVESFDENRDYKTLDKTITDALEKFETNFKVKVDEYRELKTNEESLMALNRDCFDLINLQTIIHNKNELIKLLEEKYQKVSKLEEIIEVKAALSKEGVIDYDLHNKVTTSFVNAIDKTALHLEKEYQSDVEVYKRTRNRKDEEKVAKTYNKLETVLSVKKSIIREKEKLLRLENDLIELVEDQNVLREKIKILRDSNKAFEGFVKKIDSHSEGLKKARESIAEIPTLSALPNLWLKSKYNALTKEKAAVKMLEETYGKAVDISYADYDRPENKDIIPRFYRLLREDSEKAKRKAAKGKFKDITPANFVEIIEIKGRISELRLDQYNKLLELDSQQPKIDELLKKNSALKEDYDGIRQSYIGKLAKDGYLAEVVSEALVAELSPLYEKSLDYGNTLDQMYRKLEDKKLEITSIITEIEENRKKLINAKVLIRELPNHEKHLDHFKEKYGEIKVQKERIAKTEEYLDTIEKGAIDLNFPKEEKKKLKELQEKFNRYYSPFVKTAKFNGAISAAESLLEKFDNLREDIERDPSELEHLKEEYSEKEEILLDALDGHNPNAQDDLNKLRTQYQLKIGKFELEMMKTIEGNVLKSSDSLRKLLESAKVGLEVNAERSRGLIEVRHLERSWIKDKLFSIPAAIVKPFGYYSPFNGNSASLTDRNTRLLDVIKSEKGKGPLVLRKIERAAADISGYSLPIGKIERETTSFNERFEDLKSSLGTVDVNIANALAFIDKACKRFDTIDAILNSMRDKTEFDDKGIKYSKNFANLRDSFTKLHKDQLLLPKVERMYEQKLLRLEGAINNGAIKFPDSYDLKIRRYAKFIVFTGIPAIFKGTFYFITHATEIGEKAIVYSTKFGYGKASAMVASVSSKIYENIRVVPGVESFGNKLSNIFKKDPNKGLKIGHKNKNPDPFGSYGSTAIEMSNTYHIVSRGKALFGEYVAKVDRLTELGKKTDKTKLVQKDKGEEVGANSQSVNAESKDKDTTSWLDHAVDTLVYMNSIFLSSLQNVAWELGFTLAFEGLIYGVKRSLQGSVVDSATGEPSAVPRSAKTNFVKAAGLLISRVVITNAISTPAIKYLEDKIGYKYLGSISSGITMLLLVSKNKIGLDRSPVFSALTASLSQINYIVAMRYIKEGEEKFNENHVAASGALDAVSVAGSSAIILLGANNFRKGMLNIRGTMDKTVRSLEKIHGSAPDVLWEGIGISMYSTTYKLRYAIDGAQFFMISISVFKLLSRSYKNGDIPLDGMDNGIVNGYELVQEYNLRTKNYTSDRCQLLVDDIVEKVGKDNGELLRESIYYDAQKAVHYDSWYKFGGLGFYFVNGSQSYLHKILKTHAISSDTSAKTGYEFSYASDYVFNNRFSVPENCGSEESFINSIAKKLQPTKECKTKVDNLFDKLDIKSFIQVDPNFIDYNLDCRTSADCAALFSRSNITKDVGFDEVTNVAKECGGYHKIAEKISNKISSKCVNYIELLPDLKDDLTEVLYESGNRPIFDEFERMSMASEITGISKRLGELLESIYKKYSDEKNKGDIKKFHEHIKLIISEIDKSDKSRCKVSGNWELTNLMNSKGMLTSDEFRNLEVCNTDLKCYPFVDKLIRPHYEFKNIKSACIGSKNIADKMVEIHNNKCDIKVGELKKEISLMLTEKENRDRFINPVNFTQELSKMANEYASGLKNMVKADPSICQKQFSEFIKSESKAIEFDLTLPAVISADKLAYEILAIRTKRQGWVNWAFRKGFDAVDNAKIRQLQKCTSDLVCLPLVDEILKEDYKFTEDDVKVIKGERLGSKNIAAALIRIEEKTCYDSLDSNRYFKKYLNALLSDSDIRGTFLTQQNDEGFDGEFGKVTGDYSNKDAVFAKKCGISAFTFVQSLSLSRPNVIKALNQASHDVCSNKVASFNFAILKNAVVKSLEECKSDAECRSVLISLTSQIPSEEINNMKAACFGSTNLSREIAKRQDTVCVPTVEKSKEYLKILLKEVDIRKMLNDCDREKFDELLTKSLLELGYKTLVDGFAKRGCGNSLYSITKDLLKDISIIEEGTTSCYKSLLQFSGKYLKESRLAKLKECKSDENCRKQVDEIMKNDWKLNMDQVKKIREACSGSARIATEIAAVENNYCTGAVSDNTRYLPSLLSDNSVRNQLSDNFNFDTFSHEVQKRYPRVFKDMLQNKDLRGCIDQLRSVVKKTADDLGKEVLNNNKCDKAFKLYVSNFDKDAGFDEFSPSEREDQFVSVMTKKYNLSDYAIGNIRLECSGSANAAAEIVRKERNDKIQKRDCTDKDSRVAIETTVEGATKILQGMNESQIDKVLGCISDSSKCETLISDFSTLPALNEFCNSSKFLSKVLFKVEIPRLKAEQAKIKTVLLKKKKAENVTYYEENIHKNVVSAKNFSIDSEDGPVFFSEELSETLFQEVGQDVKPLIDCSSIAESIAKDIKPKLINAPWSQIVALQKCNDNVSCRGALQSFNIDSLEEKVLKCANFQNLDEELLKVKLDKYDVIPTKIDAKNDEEIQLVILKALRLEETCKGYDALYDLKYNSQDVDAFLSKISGILAKSHEKLSDEISENIRRLAKSSSLSKIIGNMGNLSCSEEEKNAMIDDFVKTDVIKLMSYEGMALQTSCWTLDGYKGEWNAIKEKLASFVKESDVAKMDGIISALSSDHGLGVTNLISSSSSAFSKFFTRINDEVKNVSIGFSADKCNATVKERLLDNEEFAAALKSGGNLYKQLLLSSESGYLKVLGDNKVSKEVLLDCAGSKNAVNTLVDMPSFFPLEGKSSTDSCNAVLAKSALLPFMQYSVYVLSGNRDIQCSSHTECSSKLNEYKEEAVKNAVIKDVSNFEDAIQKCGGAMRLADEISKLMGEVDCKNVEESLQKLNVSNDFIEKGIVETCSQLPVHTFKRKPKPAEEGLNNAPLEEVLIQNDQSDYTFGMSEFVMSASVAFIIASIYNMHI